MPEYDPKIMIQHTFSNDDSQHQRIAARHLVAPQGATDRRIDVSRRLALSPLRLPQYPAWKPTGHGSPSAGTAADLYCLETVSVGFADFDYRGLQFEKCHDALWFSAN